MVLNISLMAVYILLWKGNFYQTFNILDTEIINSQSMRELLIKHLLLVGFCSIHTTAFLANELNLIKLQRLSPFPTVSPTMVLRASRPSTEQSHLEIASHEVGLRIHSDHLR